MRNARKTPFILNLEKEDVQSDPFSEILEPENIVKASRRSMGISKATTLSECMPRLSQIAKETGKNLNNTSEFKECVVQMNAEKLKS
ncbi:hypothetical protein LCGC14_0388880 [marine sediment metagenome]|uniref:Uncharacterized protein n=1 Tax=marine sediment metagenome TaxID=412755 RepID=A0A0F9VMG8_9ZZZZ